MFAAPYSKTSLSRYTLVTNSKLYLFAFLAFGVMLHPAWAQEKKNVAVNKIAAQQLIQKYACLSCHAIDRKLVGPSYTDIARKYKNNPLAAKQLAQKIRTGGIGTWGQIPMPGQPKIKDDELKIIVNWILADAPK